mmetsp:Transcript_139311/g.444639  ORF Transcript_139311/g.444639 Transcript_139311/m.444639 type:complete len:245 (+) Transcript_139311:143-877(+)
MRPSERGHRFMEQLPAYTKSIMFETTTDERFNNLREEVLRKRDSAIIGCITEIIVSLASMSLFDLRRSVLIPILNITLVILSGVGLHGALTLSLREVQAHGVVTTGLIIACVLNMFAEAFLTHAGMATGPLPGWIVLCLLLTPYSLNLGCSLLSLMLQAALGELLEIEDEKSGLLSADQIEAQAAELSGSDVCCVCMDKRKDAVLTPCGHRAVCVQCGDSLQSRKRNCPVCRQYINGVVRVFDS